MPDHQIEDQSPDQQPEELPQPTMSYVQPEDAVLQNAGGITLESLVKLSSERLSGWLDYVEIDPPLSELKEKADAILDDLQLASGLKGTEKIAIKLINVVHLQFERLDLRHKWYNRLIGLYPAVVDYSGALDQADLFRCLAYHYLYRGDANRGGRAVKALIDIISLRPDVPMQEAQLTQIALGSVGENALEKVELAHDILEFARRTNDRRLMAQTYGVLSYLYVNWFDSSKGFQYAQMTYIIGRLLNNDIFIGNGLHFMALAFQVVRLPDKAFPYLTLASDHNQQTGDLSRLMYLDLTWGTCYYQSQDYDRAEKYLRGSVKRLKDKGSYYAVALYMLGLTLIETLSFDDAKDYLDLAYEEYGKLKKTFDQLMTKHAISHLYWTAHIYDEAIRWAEETVNETRELKDYRRDYLINEVEKDIAKYKKSRDWAV
jgi:tetratricopeptide (TPR) repeat protein